jgi:hypothetical protein
MWPSHVSWQDFADVLNALGTVIFLVSSAVSVVRKGSGRNDGKGDDDQR